jgi:hypothetical protein
MTAQFYILGKPLSLIDAINRYAAATGSMGYAMAASSADYNGHALTLCWNDYRRYYVLEYYYGERVVLCRTTDFAVALDAGKRELARQGRGATLSITPRDCDVAVAEADADLTAGSPYKIAHTGADAWKFELVSTARRFNADHLLIAATSKEQWETDFNSYLRRGRAA